MSRQFLPKQRRSERRFTWVQVRRGLRYHETKSIYALHFRVVFSFFRCAQRIWIVIVDLESAPRRLYCHPHRARSGGGAVPYSFTTLLFMTAQTLTPLGPDSDLFERQTANATVIAEKLVTGCVRKAARWCFMRQL